MTHTTSFIVFDEHLEDAMVLLKHSNSIWRDIPPGGILLRDTRTVTAFPDRRSAKEAIQRTEAYRRAHGKTDVHEYTIRKLVSAD